MQAPLWLQLSGHCSQGSVRTCTHLISLTACLQQPSHAGIMVHMHRSRAADVPTVAIYIAHVVVVWETAARACHNWSQNQLLPPVNPTRVQHSLVGDLLGVSQESSKLIVLHARLVLRRRVQLLLLPRALKADSVPMELDERLALAISVLVGLAQVGDALLHTGAALEPPRAAVGWWTAGAGAHKCEIPGIPSDGSCHWNRQRVQGGLEDGLKRCAHAPKKPHHCRRGGADRRAAGPHRRLDPSGRRGIRTRQSQHCSSPGLCSLCDKQAPPHRAGMLPIPR